MLNASAEGEVGLADNVFTSRQKSMENSKQATRNGSKRYTRRKSCLFSLYNLSQLHSEYSRIWVPRIPFAPIPMWRGSAQPLKRGMGAHTTVGPAIVQSAGQKI